VVPPQCILHLLLALLLALLLLLAGRKQYCTH
jgi:hypothetical protein